MARLPRYFLPGQPQHLIQRGNNRNALFFRNQDYHFYLDCLQDASLKNGVAVHAYVLMTNHVHLVVTPDDEQGLPRMMQRVGLRYAKYINRLYRRTGTVWEGRYRAAPIDTDNYLLACYRYVELNPVRAGMVQQPAAYPWSSYAHHGLSRPDPVIQDHALYLALGRDGAARCRAYRSLFEQPFSEEALRLIRTCTAGGWALGNDRFREQIEAIAGRRAGPRPRGGARKGAGRRINRT